MSEKEHPLHSAWGLWYDSKKTGASNNWEEGLIQVQNFSTVEDFWIMMNHIKRPGSLEVGSNYHLFKQGIKPMWEDSANQNGGKWIVTLTLKEDLFRLDQIWEDILLALVGETLDDGENIAGIVLGKRRSLVKLAIWTKSRDDVEANMTIGERLRKTLAVSPSVAVEYYSHADVNNAAQATPTPVLKA